MKTIELGRVSTATKGYELPPETVDGVAPGKIEFCSEATFDEQ